MGEIPIPCLLANVTNQGVSWGADSGLGVKGFTVGSVNIAGIAFGTVFAVLMNLALSFGGDADADPQDQKACPAE